ncbi:MAG: thioredoxin-disulfide reductase [Chloroflexi bacterium]|nr:thioredoxin-disulfide reductase [Chloroflexota bacterium]
MKERNYDVAIVGGGPAGMSAAIYAGRARLKTVLIEKLLPGGQLLSTDVIEDYPGFRSIIGRDLARLMEEQIKDFGAEIQSDTVTGISPVDADWLVRTESGAEYRTQTVVYCPGGTPRKLGVPGEKELTARGVSYCAICDGPLFRDQVIAVVGGGDSAAEEGIYLARFGRKVYILDNDNKLEASPLLQELVFAHPRMEVRFNNVVEEIGGVGRVEWVRLRNVKDGSVSKLDVGAVFIYIGFEPNTELLKGKVQMDERGYIISDSRMRTSAPGIFAAGDVRAATTRQIINAAADGATAALQAYAYLQERRAPAPIAARRVAKEPTIRKKRAA